MLTEILFQYPFEALFRSVQYALVDNACREYLFICEYFMVKNQPALDLFNKIMGKTLNLLQVNKRGLLICSVRIITIFF